MRQVVQPASGGPVKVVEVPRPTVSSTEVLVQTVASLISSGTERSMTQLARSGLLAKARARPDLVRQVIDKARADGLGPTLRAVRSRLDQDVALGYSAAGIALEVGEHVSRVTPGQLVATAGAGKANHAELQAVPGLLCAPVPDGVPAGDAAFAAVASIALHGLRLAEVGPGSRVVVVGLGLVGQLAARLALASGCEVAGIDVADLPLERASAAGVFARREAGDDTTAALFDWSRGRGADAVVVAAAAPDSRVMARVPTLCRDRAAVVVVGDVGLDLDRRPLYEKELTLRFARSYGPGRYDRAYEEWGVDYPEGHVPFTEGRNLETVLHLLAAGRLTVADLVTHRFDVAEAPAAYDLVESAREPFLAVQLEYPTQLRDEAPVRIRPTQPVASPGVGLVGAGAFASSVLLPRMRDAGFQRFVSVASASGLSARRVAESAGFEQAVSGAEAVIDDPDVDLVVIATPHDSHARLAARALRAGKHVFCEKPLALSADELDEVEAAWRDSGRVLMVGFNRRWSGAVEAVRTHVSGAGGPLTVTYRVAATATPPGHWYGDRRQGGRLLGEVCHFVDTSAAIVGESPARAHAVGGRNAASALAEDLAVNLAFPSGSVAAITYTTSGHPRTEKERVEVLGGGHTALIDDYRATELDGKRNSFHGQDKGHAAELALLFDALRGAATVPTDALLATSRATIAAATSIGSSSTPASSPAPAETDPTASSSAS